MLVHPEFVVAEQLRRIGAKFGSAKLLAGIVEQFGLFNGVVETDGDYWSFRPFYDNEKPIPSCHAEECFFRLSVLFVRMTNFGFAKLGLEFTICISVLILE